MSDTGRKSFTDQLGDAAKPDSEKSYLEQAGDSVSGAYDRVAAAVVPNEQKSTTQKIGDSVRPESDTEKQGKSMLDSAKDVSNAVLGGEPKGQGLLG
ncbi:hypothetical protein YB2330_001532 [Saitoella coloradoensis]